MMKSLTFYHEYTKEMNFDDEDFQQADIPLPLVTIEVIALSDGEIKEKIT